MVQDNSPKVRQERQLRRKRNVRPSYDRILIVCEGEKTEPEYFKEIKNDQKLSIHIFTSKGTAPIQVVEHAERIFNEGSVQHNIWEKAFDRVYAVFDRDNHPSYLQALQKVDQLNENINNDDRIDVPFIAIPSNPCFELWLLLHYEDVTALLDRDSLYAKLKRHYSSYRKSSKDVFTETKSNFRKAHARAARMTKKSDKRSDTEPFTYIGELVDLLLDLKN